MNGYIRNFHNGLSNVYNESKSGGLIIGIIVAIAFALEKLFYIISCSIILCMIFKVFNKIIDMF